ncbi:unnamed protein product [Peronospora belbahrii]|uniref:Uncharacterized protein n=1 Tax=Peronospora belbahrii TaxID=622444 RepID=A0ABN8CJL0_9STRA|nr:unnamed protein product [Peronospora belbahrii]
MTSVVRSNSCVCFGTAKTAEVLWKGVHFSRLYGSCVTTPQAAHMTNGQLGEDVTCAFFFILASSFMIKQPPWSLPGVPASEA